jgi:uncharacterized phage protein (TIGR01671 family)
MREIKFRGKRKDNGEWAYGDLWQHEGNTWIVTVINGEAERYTVDPETVGQYTGLQDKNGREVFHKDVWQFHGLNYTVEWDAEYAMFYLKHPSKRATEDDNMHLFVLDQGDVIGNIYENPELLP